MLCGGDLGGPVVQDLALRPPGLAERMVLFNSPLPYDKERMAGMAHAGRRRRRPTTSSGRALDADALAAELATPEQRRRYIATFYSSRFWAHPGASWATPPAVFGPFGGTPRSTSTPSRSATPPSCGPRSAATRACSTRPSRASRRCSPATTTVRALLLFGPSDHVIYPAFDEMAAVVFPDHDGPHRLDDCGHFVPWEAPTRWSPTSPASAPTCSR